MFSKRVCRALHDEHGATLELSGRLSALFNREGSGVPAAPDSLTAQLLRDLSRAMETEVPRHFDFEEAQLFSRLGASGEIAIGAHLTEEHEAMRPLARRLASLARGAAANGFDESAWREFRRVGAELCDRLEAHVQKEEMALLPLLEENLDAETDECLSDTYAGNT